MLCSTTNVPLLVLTLLIKLFYSIIKYNTKSSIHTGGWEILQAFVAPTKLFALVLKRHKCLQNVRLVRLACRV